jgi:membrane fusion protein, heavy metal efflux system
MSTFKQAAIGLTKTLPTLATLAVLAGVGYVGHRTGWKIPSAATIFGGGRADEEAWCRDHGVPEATCVICRGLTVTATPPSRQLKTDTQPAVVEPPLAATKPRLVVQLPSPDVLSTAGVETAAAEMRPITEVVEANAESGYDMTRYAQVASRAAGHAVTVRVGAGERVRKGDVLALVDAAEVGRAKADFLQATALLSSRRSVLERVKTSTAAGFRNQADLVAAEADVKDATIRAFNARQALGNLGLPASGLDPEAVPAERDVQFLGIPAAVVAELDAALATANLLPVTAPLEGVIISLNVVPGEMVDPTRTLFVVADTSRMWVTAELSPPQAAQVRVGLEMSFAPDGSTGEPFLGQVAWISTEVNEKTRTVQVRADVANPGARLLAHAFGRARIALRSEPSALVVPEDALQPDGAASLVFVRLNDEVFRPRVVTTGARCGGFIEVLSGLSAGETVATAGSYILAAQANRAKLGAGCCATE